MTDNTKRPPHLQQSSRQVKDYRRTLTKFVSYLVMPLLFFSFLCVIKWTYHTCRIGLPVPVQPFPGVWSHRGSFFAPKRVSNFAPK